MQMQPARDSTRHCLRRHHSNPGVRAGRRIGSARHEHHAVPLHVGLFSVARHLFAISTCPHTAPPSLAPSGCIHEQPTAARTGMKALARQSEERFDRQHGQESSDGVRVAPLSKSELRPSTLQLDSFTRKPALRAGKQQPKRLRRRRPMRGDRIENPERRFPYLAHAFQESPTRNLRDRSSLALPDEPRRAEPVADIPGGLEQLVVRDGCSPVEDGVGKIHRGMSADEVLLNPFCVSTGHGT